LSSFNLFKIFKFSFVNVSDVLKLYQNDETHPKSRNHWQVRDALWCVAQEDGEEDGGVAARHLHLPLLRQGLFEETGRRHLALQGMPQDDRRRCLDPLHHRRRHRQKRHPSSPRNKRTSMILIHQRIVGRRGSRLLDYRFDTMGRFRFYRGVNGNRILTRITTLLPHITTVKK